MADNTVLNPGAAGDTIATDDVAGVKYPISKLAFGALDTAVLAVAGSGVVTTGTLRVTLATDVALPAGTNNIGDVDVLTIAAGDNNIGNVDIITMPNVTLAAGTNTNEVVGDVAHDAAIAGNPVTIGGVASAAAPAAVSLDQDAVRAWFLLNGAQATVVTAAGALIGGDAANGLDVDVTRLPALVAGSANIGDVDVLTVPAPLSTTGGGTEATALRVTIATDSTGLVSVDDNGGSLTIDNAQLSVVGTGTEAAAMRVTIATDSTGVLSVDDNGGSLTVDVGTALPAGANNIGDVDVLTIAAGDNNIGNVDIVTIAAGSTLIGDVGLQPRTTGGLSFFKTIDIDETEEEVKATAGQIYALHVMNLTNALLYFKIYNATAANVIVGTTVPDITIPVPANNDTDGAGFVWSIPQGIAFGTAITVAATTGIADADAGAPAANACAATVLYK